MATFIKTENFNKIVTDKEEWNFKVPHDGLCIILISARCKNWLQNAQRLFSDDDLAIQVDDYLFSEIQGKKQEFSGAGNWNGNELKDASKRILFILPLKEGTHQIKFWVGGKPFLETVEIYLIDSLNKEITLNNSFFVGKNPKSLFIDVGFKNIPIINLLVRARANKESKLGLKIDNKIQINPNKRRNKNWYWYGKELQNDVKEFQIKDFASSDVHWLSFRGFASPIIEEIRIETISEKQRYKIGRVKLHRDITLSKVANLRSTASDEQNKILAEMYDGEEVEIINERAEGKQVDYYSNIWHEIVYNGIQGFILSTFIEIEGQERERVIDLIKESCNRVGVDSNIMLAIAACESRFKPFATSGRDRIGIFQLGEDAAKDMGIMDRFDMYQNIEAGVKYYQWIEKQIIGRGNVFERRLIAWHSGIKYVLHTAKVNYDELPFPNEARKFVKNVNENLKQKDWNNIIWLSVVLLLMGIFGFLWSRPNVTIGLLSNSGILITDSHESDFFDNSEKLRPTGDVLVFNHDYNKIENIEVSELKDRRGIPYTKFAYESGQGKFEEVLDGYLSNAAWINFDYARKVFWIEREIGRYLMSTFYIPKDGAFKQIKFLYANGQSKNEISNPFEIQFIGKTINLKEVGGEMYQQPIVRNYRYDYQNNMFMEN